MNWSFHNTLVDRTSQVSSGNTEEGYMWTMSKAIHAFYRQRHRRLILDSRQAGVCQQFAIRHRHQFAIDITVFGSYRQGKQRQICIQRDIVSAIECIQLGVFFNLFLPPPRWRFWWDWTSHKLQLLFRHKWTTTYMCIGSADNGVGYSLTIESFFQCFPVFFLRKRLSFAAIYHVGLTERCF